MMLTLEVNEKEQAPLGQRIHGVGLCFYNKRGTFNYRLRRNSNNPKDTLTVPKFGASVL